MQLEHRLPAVRVRPVHARPAVAITGFSYYSYFQLASAADFVGANLFATDRSVAAAGGSFAPG